MALGAEGDAQVTTGTLCRGHDSWGHVTHAPRMLPSPSARSVCIGAIGPGKGGYDSPFPGLVFSGMSREQPKVFSDMLDIRMARDLGVRGAEVKDIHLVDIGVPGKAGEILQLLVRDLEEELKFSR